MGDVALKVVKVDGAFIWHHHEAEDEIFLVIRGRIDMHDLDDGVERIESFGEGELLSVPHGVEHRPVAAAGTELVLIEPFETSNTGNVVTSDRRRVALPI